MQRPAPGDADKNFAAAVPTSYTTANPDAADSSMLVNQLTSAGRTYTCGDTVIYFATIAVDAAAPTGESTLTVNMSFDTAFGNADNVGITAMTVILPTGDSQFASDGEETLTGQTSASAGDHDVGVPLTISTTITDIEAGEFIVLEYRGTLTCGDPGGVPAGTLLAKFDNACVSGNAGADPCAPIAGGAQATAMSANAVNLTPPPPTTTTTTTPTPNPTTVTPENPTFTNAFPVDGGVSDHTITLPPDGGGITYTVDPTGPYDGTVDTTVIATATLDDGFAWVVPLPGGWTQTSPTTATFTIQFTGIAPSTVAPPGALPRTGSAGTATMAVVAALFVLAGAASVLITRRCPAPPVA
jgi:large repetitive protein